MMKWLRKHTKQIMVVVVLFSMLAFVGGDALYSILSPRGASKPFAKIFGREVTDLDLQPARYQTNVLQQLSISWQYDMLDQQMNISHWYMLAREAELAGIVVSDAEVEESLENLREALIKRGAAPDYIESLRTKARITLMDIHAALKQHLAIQKYFARVSGAARPSEPEIRHQVRDTQDKVRVQFVALDARSFVETDQPVDEQALQAHFETYKDVASENSDAGFGYRLPRRVRVEYLVTSISEIEKGLQVTQDEQTAHWRKNRARFTKEIEVQVPTTNPTATQPAKVKQTVEMTFSEAQDRVTKEILRNKSLQLAQQAMRKVARELIRPWENEKPDPTTGFKSIPASVQEPGYLQTMGQRLGAELGVPIAHQQTGLLTQQQLGGVSDLQYAAMNLEGGKRLTAAEYAFRVAPFFKPDPRRNEDMSTWLQLFQAPDVPLQGMTFEFAGNTFVQDTKFIIFRVVEAREAETPQSLAEVRDAVEQDYRQKLAYERIEPVAKEMAKAASLVGLDEAITLFADLRDKHGVATVNKPQPFARRTSLATTDENRFMEALMSGKPTVVPPAVSGVGRAEEVRVLEGFIDACFEMTADGWQPESLDVPETEHIKMATTRPAPASAPQVRIVGVPQARKWFVVQLLGREPVDEGRFESELRASAESALMRERWLRLRANWFSPAQIEARAGLTLLTASGAEVPTEFGGLQPRGEME